MKTKIKKLLKMELIEKIIINNLDDWWCLIKILPKDWWFHTLLVNWNWTIDNYNSIPKYLLK